MYLIFALLMFTQVNTTTGYDPRNVDVPYLTTMIEQGDGARISLLYRAVHWGPSTASATQALKMSMNNFKPQMGVLETNVQLKIGRDTIDPGRYYLGIVKQQPQDQWIFMISDEQRSISRQQLHLNTEEEQVRHLSFVFRPGVTNRDFIFSFLYGNLSTSFRWTITGVPARLMEQQKGSNAHSRFNLQAEERLGAFSVNGSKAANSTISPATKTHASGNGGSNTSPNKKKAGSGAFRKIFEQKKDEN